MIDKQRIEELIFEGLVESYIDNYSFTGQINSIIKPESLIHINIAKKLKIINDDEKDFGSPLIIKLEESTKKFATACVPFETKEDLWSSSIREFHDSECRPGKIDIALYTKDIDDIFDEKPYAAIEIKDFIKDRGDLKKDINRNIEFLNMFDKNTGKSRLEQVYICCIHEHKGALSKEEKETKIKQIESDYSKYLKNFNLDSKNLKVRFVIKSVAEYLIGKDDNVLPQDIIDDKVAFAFHFIGAITIIEKK